MDKVLLALFTGIAIPVAMMVIRRHYEKAPEHWEPIYLMVGCAIAAVAISIFLFGQLDAIEASAAGAGGRAVVGILAVYLLFAAAICCLVAWSDSESLRNPPDRRVNPPM